MKIQWYKKQNQVPISWICIEDPTTPWSECKNGTKNRENVSQCQMSNARIPILYQERKKWTPTMVLVYKVMHRAAILFSPPSLHSGPFIIKMCPKDVANYQFDENLQMIWRRFWKQFSIKKIGWTLASSVQCLISYFCDWTKIRQNGS